MKSYKRLDVERENLLRHLESRGVDIVKLVHRSNPSKEDLKKLLAGLMSLEDTYAPKRSEFGV
jgi:hypothetical protein